MYLNSITNVALVVVVVVLLGRQRRIVDSGQISLHPYLLASTVALRDCDGFAYLISELAWATGIANTPTIARSTLTTS